MKVIKSLKATVVGMFATNLVSAKEREKAFDKVEVTKLNDSQNPNL